MKKGFICGVFDLFHVGHIRAFEECREHCSHLTVALNSAENIDPKINPGKEAPIFPLSHRVEILENCKLVDEVLTYTSEGDLVEILAQKSFDVRFLGQDYKGKPITAEDATKEIYYLNRDHGFSTSGFKALIRKGING